MPRNNLVQAEFFHVGGEGSTLESVLQECAERINENFELALSEVETNSRIKTVVRFFDNSGTLTAHVREESRVRGLIKRLQDQLLLGNFWLANSWYNLKLSRLYEKRTELESKRMVLTYKLLQDVVKSGKPIAVEKNDHSFRPVRDDERYDLLVAANRGKDLWLFIFKTAGILTNEPTPVTHIM